MIDSSVLWLWGSSSGSSVLLTLWWFFMTYRLHPHLASPFHHFLTLILVFRSTYMTATYLYFQIELEETKTYFALLEAVTFTLYNAFLFMALVVLSKGFMTLRHSFTREEFSRFTCLLGIFYIVFGIYRMNLQAMYWLYVVVTATAGLYCLYEAFQSVKIAKHYLAQLQRHSLRDMRASAEQKLRMLQFFCLICAIYFGNEIINILLAAFISSDLTLVKTALYHSLEFVAVAALHVLFRVQYLDPFFGIVDFFEWEDDQDWRPAEMYQAHILPCPIEPGREQLPILVGLPCDLSTLRFKLERYEIGQLEQPLLATQT